MHLRAIRQTYFCPEGKITDSQRRLDDKAFLLLTIGTGDAAYIDMHCLTLMAHPTPIDREPDEAFTITHEILKHMGMERRRTRTGIDLGRDSDKAKLGQADKLAPAYD